MLFQALYIFTFLILGAIPAFLIFYFLFSFGFLIPAVILGLAVLTVFIKWGMRQSQKVMHLPLDERQKILGRTIFKTAGILMAFSLFLIWFGAGSPWFKAKENAAVEKIELSQTKEALEVNVAAAGPSNAPEVLYLRIATDGYTKSTLKEFQENVSLKFSKQKFSFELPFEDMAKSYRQILNDYIPVFKDTIVIDEDLRIDAGFSPEDLKTFGVAKFSFSCSQESCTIIQQNPQENQ